MFDRDKVKRIPVTEILEPAAPGIHKMLGRRKMDHYVRAADYDKLLALYDDLLADCTRMALRMVNMHDKNTSK